MPEWYHTVHNFKYPNCFFWSRQKSNSALHYTHRCNMVAKIKYAYPYTRVLNKLSSIPVIRIPTFTVSQSHYCLENTRITKASCWFIRICHFLCTRSFHRFVARLASNQCGSKWVKSFWREMALFIRPSCHEPVINFKDTSQSLTCDI